MPGIIGAPAGTYITVRLYKKLTTNPAIVWANMYEFHALAAITEPSITVLIQNMISFESTIHLTSVEFDRIVVSTWVPDGDPYDPTSFLTEPISGSFGTRTNALDPLPLQVCAFIRRVPVSGRNGKIFYRRALHEGDMVSPSGTPALSAGSTWVNDFNTAKLTLGDYLGAGAEFELVMKSALLINRPIQGLQAAGIRIMQYNNRYYDIPNAP